MNDAGSKPPGPDWDEDETMPAPEDPPRPPHDKEDSLEHGFQQHSLRLTSLERRVAELEHWRDAWRAKFKRLWLYLKAWWEEG